MTEKNPHSCTGNCKDGSHSCPHHKEVIISVKNLSFSYGDTVVLKDINLDVEENTILAIIGPNGGGKTTLLKILLGLLRGYSGEVNIRCIKKESHRRKHHLCLSYVPQKERFNRRFPATVYDAVEMGLYGFTGFRGPDREDRDYIRWVLEEVGMWDKREYHVSNLSGGQLQRVLIARALVSQPSVLFLDEPLVGIDQLGIVQFIELLLQLKKELGLTVVMVSHNFNAVSLCADKMACLDRTIHFHDNPDHITQDDINKVYSCGFDAFHSLEPHKHKEIPLINGE